MLKDALLLNSTNFTENGALTNPSTGSAILNFFAQAGANRDRDFSAEFSLAQKEDFQKAVALLFYFRDIRGGQGERKLFKTLFTKLAQEKPSVAEALIPLIPMYGRWDDLYCLVGTPLEESVFSFMRKQLLSDLKSEKPSLLAKWLKSLQASSLESRKLADKTRKAFKMDEKTYRKALSSLRAKLSVVEKTMSARDWEDINYSHVPSKALRNYQAAFRRNDCERYSEFLKSLEDGTGKLNASTLYPHEIVNSVLERGKYLSSSEETLLNAQWISLPAFPLENTLPVVDVSGSMYTYISEKSKVSALDVSVGLGIYCAENLKGDFKNHFITFSKQPKLEALRGDNLVDKVRHLSRAEWGMNTNLESVFSLLLRTAVLNRIPKKEMPKRILIISDMEFDAAALNQDTNYDAIKRQYEKAGYEAPLLIFWNVCSRNTHFPMTIRDEGLMVSGYSPAVLKFIFEGRVVQPMDVVDEIVSSPRYKPVLDILSKF